DGVAVRGKLTIFCMTRTAAFGILSLTRRGPFRPAATPLTVTSEADPMTRFSPLPFRLGVVLAALIAAFPLLTFLTAAHDGQPTDKLEIRPGDHICLVGNTLPERMQHDGWLETYLHSRFPTHDLVVRNLAFSGDALTLRLRSQNFGTPDYWLTATKADVILAFFGYNESFGGEVGLGKFKSDLDSYLKHLLGKQYNGKSAPRVVLFSPIGHEDLHDRNLPDGAENNKRLALYTSAMAEVAKTNKVPFVDLYQPSRQLYAKTSRPLTVNGIHLNDYGNEL